MTVPNTEPVATPATTPAVTDPPPATLTEAETTAAVNKAAASLPDNPTGKDFAEMINALPERIVDALREATATGPSGASTGGGTPPVATTEDAKGGPWFGFKTFGEFWTGKAAE